MEKKVYSFNAPELFGKMDAEKAAKELERISLKYGELKPEYVVTESEDEGSVLHSYFTWDDSKAACLWRKQQARTLINSIKVEIKHEEVKVSVRAFVNVREEKRAPRSYVPIYEVMKNEVAYNDLLLQAKDDMQSFVVTYAQLTELNAVKAEMLKVLNNG